MANTMTVPHMFDALLLLLFLLISSYSATSAPIAYQVVKSGLYPRLSARLKSFRDSPVHGPVVTLQVWYSDTRAIGIRTTFLDNYTSPVHGYVVGNTSTLTFDPNNNDLLNAVILAFGSITEAGIVGGVTVGTARGNRTLTQAPQILKRPGSASAPPFFGAPFDASALGTDLPGAVLGFKGVVDEGGIAQLGVLKEIRPLAFSARPRSSSRLPYWPKTAVVRSVAKPRLPDGLRPFDDGITGEHGEIVKVQLWESDTLGVVGIRSTFQDGYRSAVHGYRGNGTTVDLTFESNPLVAVGGRGSNANDDGVYQLGGVAFFAGGTSPPARTRIYGLLATRTYSDSADGRIVGLFGQVGPSAIAQLGVHFVSPANGLVLSSGPFPLVSPPASVPFDHTGDNVGVSRIDVYHSNTVGVRGLRFTYVSHRGFEYATPVYGQKAGLREQVRFDYVDDPLVNVGIQVANVFAGTGEVGVYGIDFFTLKGNYVGQFGLASSHYNLSDGTRRVVGFHGQADTVLNALGVYTAPLHATTITD